MAFGRPVFWPSILAQYSGPVFWPSILALSADTVLNQPNLIVMAAKAAIHDKLHQLR